MTITFDRKLELRRFKNESCSKRDNEAPKFHRLGFIFYIFLIFHPFFYILTFDLTYLYLLENSKFFCDVFLYRLEIYQPIIFFFKMTTPRRF